MRFNRGDPDAVPRWIDGISVYDSFAHACEVAAARGFSLGSYVAVLTLANPELHEVSPYGLDEHHYTIFGNAEELILLVTEVIRVPGAP